MYSYSFEKAYNLQKLNDEIMASNLPIATIDWVDATHFVVNSQNQLTNLQQLTLNSVVEAHNSAMDVKTLIASKIAAARQWGVQLMDRQAAENVMAGYDIETIEHIMDTADKVMIALRTGSLYVAIARLNRITPDEVLTVAKLKAMRNEIEDYLKIPRT